MSDRINQITVIVTGIIALSLVTSAAEAQQSPSGASTNTVPGLPTNFGNNPVRESNIFIEPNNSSQEFFEQGREQLFLLPEDSGENILKIDETIEVEGVKYDDLQPKLPNRQ
jgi:hypothetical protein